MMVINTFKILNKGTENIYMSYKWLGLMFEYTYLGIEIHMYILNQG